MGRATIATRRWASLLVLAALALVVSTESITHGEVEALAPDHRAQPEGVERPAPTKSMEEASSPLKKELPLKKHRETSKRDLGEGAGQQKAEPRFLEKMERVMIPSSAHSTVETTKRASTPTAQRAMTYGPLETTCKTKTKGCSVTGWPPAKDKFKAGNWSQCRQSGFFERGSLHSYQVCKDRTSCCTKRKCTHGGTQSDALAVDVKPPLQIIGDGFDYGCSLTTTGRLQCWGNVPLDKRFSGTALRGEWSHKRFQELSVGPTSLCALTKEEGRSDGNIMCF